MMPARRSIPFFSSALVGLSMLGAVAQEDELFDFIPDGGRGLLEVLRAEGMSDDLTGAISSEAHDVSGWQDEIGNAGGFDDWEKTTLAQYLAAYAPLDAGGALPGDGRDLALRLCQSCHIITVVVTQDRTREAWLGTLNSPSHIEIEMDDRERQLLADYLVVNAGIPIDAVPPPLRAGGASY